MVTVAPIKVGSLFIIIANILLLGAPLTFAQSPTTQPTKKELRKQQKQDKQFQKEQLSYKADSIKIAAMLQLRNATEGR